MHDKSAARGFDESILEVTAHRPWPLPDRPWVMRQTWNDLLFAHWPVPSAQLRPLVPEQFAIDERAGSAWVGIVPFHMTNVAPRFVPAVPVLSVFPELNVRTYVTLNGRPGVYFFSLDAGSSAAVIAARSVLNLPYYSATMKVMADGMIDYLSERDGNPAAMFEASYGAIAEPIEPAPGSLEYFLTERYCLYALDHAGKPYELEIHHRPWRLARAVADIRVNGMAAVNGIELPSNQPLLHFSRRQDMVCWWPETKKSGVN